MEQGDLAVYPREARRRGAGSVRVQTRPIPIPSYACKPYTAVHRKPWKGVHQLPPERGIGPDAPRFCTVRALSFVSAYTPVCEHIDEVLSTTPLLSS